MQKVFISSVVSGFEEYRQAAKEAVQLTCNHPVMCEDFGSRPHNSETACMTEVEGSDIYILILSTTYGFIPPNDDVSVTHREYLTAKARNIPILVFVHTCEMEPKQKAFLNTVQDYVDGYFRTAFQTPEELKNAIVKSVSALRNVIETVPESAFQESIGNAVDKLHRHHEFGSNSDTRLQIALWRQPPLQADIIAMERQSEELFGRMCRAGLATLRDGYDVISDASFTALVSENNSMAFFTDGLVLLSLDPQIERDQTGCSMNSDFLYVAPSRVRQLVLGSLEFQEGFSCWFSLKMTGMDHKIFKELPDPGVSSHSGFSMFSSGSLDYRKLFSPYNAMDFESWLDNTIELIKRALNQ